MSDLPWQPWELHLGEVPRALRKLKAGSVQCIVTSPPYWRQRDFGLGPDQLGQELRVDDYVKRMVAIGRSLRRVLADDGALWLNLGDSYIGRPSNGSGYTRQAYYRKAGNKAANKRAKGLPDKSLVGVPWRVALGLQADGWVLRCEIIWHKNNAQPQSIPDRPSTCHEHIFLLTKKPKYYYDKAAASEPQKLDPSLTRNLRTVWTMPVSSRRDEHYAPFPSELPRRCIAASTKRGDLVLDPFVGSGTTGVEALWQRRRFVGIDASESSLRIAERKLLLVREKLGGLTFAEAELLARYKDSPQVGLGLEEDDDCD